MYYTLIILVLIILGSATYAAASGAPWVPTWKKDIERLHKILDLKQSDHFVELGCGDGRICQFFAKNSRANITGVELSLLQWTVARLRAAVSGSNVRFILGNVFAHNLSSYTVVYLFLMPETYKKLRPKLEKELRPGTRVVSYVWPIPGWNASHVDHEEHRPDLHVYTI